MANAYCSFLLRCWHLGSGTERIEIEHIHSGTRTVVTSLQEALEWMSACSEYAPSAPGSTSAELATSDVRFDALALRYTEGRKE